MNTGFNRQKEIKNFGPVFVLFLVLCLAGPVFSSDLASPVHFSKLKYHE